MSLDITACWAKLNVTSINKVYNGSAHTASASVTGAQGYTISYSTDNGQTWTQKKPALTDVGELTFKVKAEIQGWRTLEGEGKVDVTKRPITVTAEHKDDVV